MEERADVENKSTCIELDDGKPYNRKKTELKFWKAASHMMKIPTKTYKTMGAEQRIDRYGATKNTGNNILRKTKKNKWESEIMKN